MAELGELSDFLAKARGLFEEARAQAQTDPERFFLNAVASLLSALGECRLLEPYAPLRPVLTKDGLKWCCTHDPEHCA
jgi:hypothetical protein